MDTNRPIYIGDGVIPQLNRYANKHVYNNLSLGVFETALGAMSERSDKPTGNTYTFVCNEKQWRDVNRLLATTLMNSRADGTYLWSKAKNGYVDVGATYQSYSFAGNTVIFRVDRSLTLEFGSNRGYGFLLDLTPDMTTNTPAVNMFTLKNSEFISNYIQGVGGINGNTSGQVASNVAGNHRVIMGYAGVGVMNPYKAFFLMEA